MYIVYQNGTEIVPLHHAYTMYGEIMHFSPEDDHANRLASYNDQDEAQKAFDLMLDYVKAGAKSFRLPPARTAPSEPLSPAP